MCISNKYEIRLNDYERLVKSPPPNLPEEYLATYIHLGLSSAMACQSAKLTKARHLRVMTTLENCICDPLLCYTWRKACNKQLKRLMPLLFELVPINEYQTIRSRIKTLSGYFLIDRQVKSENAHSKNISTNDSSSKKN